VLRCAGSTVRGVRRQEVIQAALYAGTALLFSLLEIPPHPLPPRTHGRKVTRDRLAT